MIVDCQRSSSVTRRYEREVETSTFSPDNASSIWWLSHATIDKRRCSAKSWIPSDGDRSTRGIDHSLLRASDSSRALTAKLYYTAYFRLHEPLNASTRILCNISFLTGGSHAYNSPVKESSSFCGIR